ncbi:hypothetical protein BD311DRAFT_770167 [Dichomitus squalens]|uniref:Uncharacterized protein n=1 Tax=Dichomitus squalens TaxID=114155 RepID=A0A4Q9M6P1_9APHY|nr:hypothetical protein BD311DRAFT_770167 [Dichomitus squalens]
MSPTKCTSRFRRIIRARPAVSGRVDHDNTTITPDIAPIPSRVPLEKDTVITSAHVRAVRGVLCALGLPMELVLITMNLADYYATVRSRRTGYIRIDAHDAGVDVHAARLYLIATLPQESSGDELMKVVKVTWLVKGHDQGWGGEAPGMYSPAYSWYEACIFRRVHSAEEKSQKDINLERLYRFYRDAEMMERKVLAPAGWSLVRNGDSCVWRLQSNRIAKGEFERHTFVWTADGVSEGAEDHGAGAGEGFVKSLRAGDKVGILMRASYPGWSNSVNEAGIEIAYEVR